MRCKITRIWPGLLTLLAFSAHLVAADELPRDLAGKALDPLASNQVVVLVFVAVDCPISNRYVPELKRLHEQFSSTKVRFHLVYPDPRVTAEAVRKHAREFQLPAELLLLDPKQVLVKRARATVTPEAAVFDSKGQLRYYGRIDDRYVHFGRARPAPTQRDLEKVLSALLAGQLPATNHQRAIGCYIPDLP